MDARLQQGAHWALIEEAGQHLRGNSKRSPNLQTTLVLRQEYSAKLVASSVLGKSFQPKPEPRTPPAGRDGRDLPRWQQRGQRVPRQKVGRAGAKGVLLCGTRGGRFQPACAACVQACKMLLSSPPHAHSTSPPPPCRTVKQGECMGVWDLSGRYRVVEGACVLGGRRSPCSPSCLPAPLLSWGCWGSGMPMLHPGPPAGHNTVLRPDIPLRTHRAQAPSANGWWRPATSEGLGQSGGQVPGGSACRPAPRMRIGLGGCAHGCSGPPRQCHNPTSNPHTRRAHPYSGPTPAN